MLQSFLGGSLYGSATGSAAPWLLALHGWQRSNADFDQVVGERRDLGDLGTPIDAIAPDLPGFGASPAPPEGWGSKEYAEFLLPLLEIFEQPPVVLGHSFGGRVAIHLAAAYPAHVRALVLTGVPLIRPDNPGRSALGFRVVRRAASIGLVSEKRLEAARQRYGSRDYRESSGVMRAVLVRTVQERYDEQLDAVTQQVEMVWGELDTAAPVDLARVASSRLACAQLEVLPGVGHLVPTEAPDALRAAVLRLAP